jgi:hypothetical protein
MSEVSKAVFYTYITKLGEVFAIHTYNFEILKLEAIISANTQRSFIILVCDI